MKLTNIQQDCFSYTCIQNVDEIRVSVNLRRQNPQTHEHYLQVTCCLTWISFVLMVLRTPTPILIKLHDTALQIFPDSTHPSLCVVPNMSILGSTYLMLLDCQNDGCFCFQQHHFQKLRSLDIFLTQYRNGKNDIEFFLT